jgi:hypothetical protein
MEKTLQSIDKKTTGGSSAAGGGGVDAGSADSAVGTLAAMANSIKLITDAVANKNFNKKNANTILEFISGIATTASKVKPENLTALGEASSGIARFVDVFANISLLGIAKVALLGKILFGGKTPLIETIIGGAVKAVEKFSAENLQKIKNAGEGISVLATSLVILGKAMAILALVALISPLVIMGGVTAFLVVGMFALIGTKLKEVKEGFEAVGILGKGLIVLAAGLATMAIVASYVSLKTYMEIIAVVASFALVFALIGKAGQTIAVGAKGVRDMGIALIAFSAGVAMISLVTMLVPAKNLLMGAMTVAVYALAFYFIGKMSGEIADGALTIILGIAVGLFFFSAAMLLLNYTFERFSFENALMAGAVLTGFGLLFAGLGYLEKWIDKGAYVVFAMGVALAAFSVGILLYALSIKAILALFKGDYTTAAIAAPAIILGLGLVIAGIGLLAGPIIAGANSLALMGIGLAFFSVGMLLFALSLKAVLKLFEDDYAKAAIATVAIIGGFTALFSLAGLALPLVALGAASIILMGAALIVFSVGLTIFALSTKLIMKMGLYDEKKDEFKGINILGSIAMGIAGLAQYFIPVLIGTPVAIMLGVALMTISAGLIAAAVAIDKIPDTKKFTDKLFSPDKGIIPALAKGFSDIYKNLGGGGFLGALATLTGTDPVQMGMRMVRGMGDVLQDLAGGIAAFANFEEFPVKVPDPKDPSRLIYKSVNLFDIVPKIKTALIGDGTLSSSSSGILTSLASVFADIGAKFGSTGFFSDSLVEQGVDAVRGIGGALQGLAGGIIAFANFEEFPVQVPDAKDPSKLIYKAVNLFDVVPKIKEVLVGDGSIGGGGILLSLASVFADIARKFPGGFFSDSAVQQGVDAVKDIGSVVTDLAGGITAFANLENFPIEYDPVTGKATKYGPVDLDAVTKNIKKVLTRLPNVFAGLDIEKFENAQEIAEAALPLSKTVAEIAKSFGSINKIYAEAEKSKSKDGGDPIQALSTSIKSMATTLESTELSEESLGKFERLAEIFESLADSADGFSKFTDAFTKLQDPLSRFAVTLGIMGNNFSKMSKDIANYQKFVWASNSLADRAKGYHMFAPAFGSMSNSMGTFAVNFKVMDSEAIRAFDTWTNSLLEVSKIDEGAFSGVVGKMKEFFTLPFKQGATEQGKPAETAETAAGQKKIVAAQNKAEDAKPVSSETPSKAPAVNMAQVVTAMNSVKTAISALNDTLTKNGVKILT